MRTRGLLTGDLTRKHWNERTAARVLGVWRASSESLSGFARTNGLNAGRLRAWRKRLEGGAHALSPSVAAMTFIPAAVVGGARAVVRLPHGVELEGDTAALPVDWVASLARALEQA
jgi:transposase-like protein